MSKYKNPILSEMLMAFYMNVLKMIVCGLLIFASVKPVKKKGLSRHDTLYL